MDSDDKSPFMKMIEREYETISKNYFKTVANKNLSKEDNEDIFHNTIKSSASYQVKKVRTI